VRRIKIDRNLCIGCLTCVTACQTAHEDSDSRNRVTIDSGTKPAPIFCRHCKEAECVFTCMTGAMRKNPDTGFVDYDDTKCAACFMCVLNCPYGVLKPEPVERRRVMKCDMCQNTPDKKPFCVEKCPMKAITLEEAAE